MKMDVAKICIGHWIATIFNLIPLYAVYVYIDDIVIPYLREGPQITNSDWNINDTWIPWVCGIIMLIVRWIATLSIWENVAEGKYKKKTYSILVICIIFVSYFISISTVVIIDYVYLR